MAKSATVTVSWPWLYQLHPEGSDQLKEALKDLVEDETDLAEIDFSTEEFYNTVDGCIAYIAEKVIDEPAPQNGNTLEVNFKDQTVKLPDFVATLHSVDPQVKAKDVRYVGIVSGTQEGVPCDDQVVLLSIWITVGRAILNIYLRLSSIKDSLLLVNSVSKMLYEACNKSAARMEKFHLVRAGPVLVSKCTVEERDERDKIELEKAKKKSDASQSDEVNGTLEADTVEKKEGKEEAMEEVQALEERKMSFMLDQESLCLFDHPLSPKAVWDFRFYKESVENAIDVIYVCNTTGQLEIEQQQKVFYISSSNKEGTGDKNFEYLSDTLRKGTMKPKPQEIFTDLLKFVDFFHGTRSSKTKAESLKPGTSSSSSYQPPPSTSQHMSTPYQTREEHDSWLTNLLTGSHLQNCTEDLQILWFELVDELQKCISENLVPESAIESSGLDPNYPEHLLTAVEDIKDKLKSKNFPTAVSRLRRMKKIFGESLIRSITQLDEVEILKRIFFLSW